MIKGLNPGLNPGLTPVAGGEAGSELGLEAGAEAKPEVGAKAEVAEVEAAKVGLSLCGTQQIICLQFL